MLPNVGLLRVQDLETGAEQWVDSSSKKVRNQYNRWWYERQQVMSETFKRCRVNSCSVATDEDYVTALMGLFRNRKI
jgi:uncharacterized protein (DUF58 family)